MSNLEIVIRIFLYFIVQKIQKNIHLILFMTKKKILEEYGEIYKEYLNDDENVYNDFKKHGYY